MKKENGKIVRLKKPVSTIHIDSNNLSLIQKKCFNILLWVYYKSGYPEKDWYEIKVSTLTTLLGYRGRNETHLLQSMKRLSKTLIEWDIMDDNQKRDMGFSVMISQSRIKGGILYYSIPSSVKELVKTQQIYSLIKINITSLFSSKYSLSLYENVYRYKDTDRKITPMWDIDTFRKLVGCGGKKLYDDFFVLRTRVIKPSVKEINDITDIQIKPEYKRSGRKVVGVRFHITKQQQQTIFPSLIDNQMRQEISEMERQVLFDTWKKERIETILKGFDKKEMKGFEKKFVDTIKDRKTIHQRYKQKGLEGVSTSYYFFCEESLLDESEKDYEIWKKQQV